MNYRNITALLLSLAMSVLCSSSFAQELKAAGTDADAPDTDANVAEITRSATDLRDVLVPRPDLDSVDTALVFTNPRNASTWVVCAGHDANGDGVGRARTRVPAHGVRLIFASDLSNGRDFIGSAACKSRSWVVPSAFIIGTDLSDAPARTSNGWSETRINFPIVATF